MGRRRVCGEEDSLGLSFQPVTLDHSGSCGDYHPDPHESEPDLGLVPGGKVKQIKNVP